MLSAEARVEAARAVERARYAFVLGARRPFDEAYPRAVFEARVAREIKEERVLERVFGLSMTPELLAGEYERIERSTKAPEQWEAVKRALGGDRRMIEEVFCRPLLVGRTLRLRFAFDPAIHAAPHGEAREARARLLRGEPVEGVKIVTLSRGPVLEGTEAMLEDAKARAAGPQLIEAQPPPEGPQALDPEAAQVLEQQLKRPGDVSTILSERDRFSVYRLIEARQEAWVVEAIVFPKVDFEAWFAGKSLLANNCRR